MGYYLRGWGWGGTIVIYNKPHYRRLPVSIPYRFAIITNVTVFALLPLFFFLKLLSRQSNTMDDLNAR